ncbi:Fe(3+) dicitrate transport protein FecA [BD1-7 clade bacterium]|uniref:Fe(3+) dicitrate transport protein FecA n=1 Tax=BD1-7 clade bacterium TaxID=2029982 RepID=A0A5S9NW87_9GAMM|nr:Fe(3+) dicitrate transport protein FecA [BD1-7 clade bacterium]CAA0095557.1 Fe(3+) dicitrate transport protein FecA [BD1-7 clade bacterium]
MKKLLITLAAATSVVAVAQENEEAPKADNSVLEETLIIGSKDDVKALTGSASVLDRTDLEAFNYTDLERVLTAVPGVYIRNEDGFGLRPNIAIRGVTSDRSQKITIMEDGILITPAPYSAPAAYYIPNVNRMNSVEVFKGPASIEYGPNTVGGAINLATRPIPADEAGDFSATYGSYNFQKYNAYYGKSYDNFGWAVDALRYSSDGFKELDGGGNTGFVRNDINLKFMVKSDDDAKYPQRLTLKLGYADEDADETYLGLSDEDFDKNPLRRYRSSQLDHFESKHYQTHALHTVKFADELKLVSKAYFNRFDRTWFRLAGFGGDAPALSDILADTNRFSREYQLLTGQRNSDPSNEEDTFVLTNNDREYGSQGFESKLTAIMQTGDIEHQLVSGFRYHNDYVRRDQPTFGYLMVNGRLVADGDGKREGEGSDNRAESDAVALYINDTMTIGDWTLNVGSRFEYIDGKFTNFQDGTKSSRTTAVAIPGIGTLYQVTEELSLLAGINKGFSPAGPASDESVNPEESVNYEYGGRYSADGFDASLIGFFSDYSNLIGRCRASDPGCDLGDEFNGGSVQIAGLEAEASYIFDFDGILWPMSLTYTYTESAFQSSFDSTFSQWGNVDKGDELPYLPNNQLRFETGLNGTQWDVFMSVNYVGEMREVAGQSGSADTGAFTEKLKPLTTVDLSASYFITDNWRVQMALDNVFNAEQIVSRRPFGGRPNKPFTASATVGYRF